MSRKPWLIGVLDIGSILFLFWFGLCYRKYIGLKPSVLVAIFGSLPFLVRSYALTTGGHDYIYLACGIAVFVAYLYLDHQILAELEHKQRLKSEHYHDIISSAGNGVWTIRIEQGESPVMECDQKMKILLGIDPLLRLSPKEVYDFWYSRITPEALPSVEASVDKMMKGGFDENTYLWNHPNKGKIYVRCGGQATKKSDGTFLLSGYHADVTEIVLADKQHALELQTAREEAEAANAAKTSFLFNMSHDIRTPMNAIIGFTNLLRKHQEEPAKRADYLEKIEQSSSVLLSIINNVLEMARIEKGTISIDEKVVNVRQFCESLFVHQEDLIRAKGIEFCFTINTKHDYFLIDATKVGEITRNILSNAYKYTNSGGKISVKIEELPSEKEGYGNVRTEVSDTGIGMSQEFLPHLFDEFSRENSSTDNKIEGTGLGMPIVKRLVELLHGTIDVQSEKGAGTTISITLPHKIADPADMKEVGGVAYDPTLFKDKRILLAEDNDLNAEIATEILQEVGFVIDRAVDGRCCVDMLEAAANNYYTCILMDVQMPNMNGYEATSAIRSMTDRAKSGIPIIAMTANAFEEDKRRAYAVGMDGHIAKPIVVADLMQKIQQCCVLHHVS